MPTFFNTKHLTKGDPAPAYNGKLRLYSMRFCPYAQRAVLALNAKNIDYEIVNIDLVNKPDWYTSKCKSGKVPALEIADGVCIYESLVIVEYLDDVYPERPLLPKDPLKKAFDKIIIEAAAPISGLQMKTVENITDDVLEAYYKALDFLQRQLQERGTTFLGGDEPGYADYMIWPWFERLRVYDDERVQIDNQKFNRIVEYLDKISKDPVVEQYAIPTQVYKDIFQAFVKDSKTKFDDFLEWPVENK